MTGQCYTNISAEREIRMKKCAGEDDCKVIIARVRFVISINFLDGKMTYKPSDRTHFLLKRSNDDGFTVRLLGVPGFAKSAVYSRFMRERALRGYGSDWKSIMMAIGRYCFSTINEEIYEIISLTGMRQTRALALKVRPETTLIGRTDREGYNPARQPGSPARQRLAIAMLLHPRLGRDSIFMTVSQTLPFQDIIPTVGGFLFAREVIYRQLPSYGHWTDTDSGYAISAVDRPSINRITGWLVHCRQEEKKQAQARALCIANAEAEAQAAVAAAVAGAAPPNLKQLYEVNVEANVTNYALAYTTILVKAYSADHAQTYIEQLVDDAEFSIYDYQPDEDNNDTEADDAIVENCVLSNNQAGAEDLEADTESGDDDASADLSDD
jgi:hypothetical protein